MRRLSLCLHIIFPGGCQRRHEAGVGKSLILLDFAGGKDARQRIQVEAQQHHVAPLERRETLRSSRKQQSPPLDRPQPRYTQLEREVVVRRP